MRTLVTAASKHGATAEIALSIAQTLESDGHEVVVARPEEFRTLDRFDAVVLGSAIYGGRWLNEARDFVQLHEVALKRMPVWLFSSGPIGEPAKPETLPIDVEPTMRELDAREHRLFPGRLVKHDLGFAEKAVAIALRAPDGDFRPWTEIEDWAHEIGRQLSAEEAAEAEPGESTEIAKVPELDAA
jgi:menaquinone-dependent protoporphyrinogen oxidase